jgi:phage shock protein PspC (stress-responsive transcriptional regulator)
MVLGPGTAQAIAMTTTPPEAPSGPPPQDPVGDTGPRVDRDQVRDLGRLRRSRTDRKVAGVAGGLGRHLDVDPLILRVAFVVLVFFGGAGLIVYGACWVLVPEDGDERAPFNLDDRTRSVALLIVGVVAALALIGDSWGAFWFPWPLALVALVALWLLTRNSPPRDATPAPAPYTPDHPSGSYPPPQPQQLPTWVPPAPRPPNPRKRGPILFWFTLALIALCEGLLGVVDVAGVDVAGPAYFALPVAICGVMLVVGAFFGRAGGLILVGLVATVLLAAATAADSWDTRSVTVAPATAAEVEPSYRLDVGEQVIDLRDVTDLQALDGRRIRVDGDVGRIEVVVPDGLAVDVTADIDGPANVVLFGDETGDIGVTEHAVDGSTSDPQITLDAQLDVGQIEVHR